MAVTTTTSSLSTQTVMPPRIPRKFSISLNYNDMERVLRRAAVSASFAGMVILYSPTMEYAALTLVLALLYVWINAMVENFFPGNIVLDGKPSPKFRLYTSIFHDGIIAGGLLVAILILRANHLSDWLIDGWKREVEATDDAIFLDNLDAFALCITIAFEIKDGLVDDFDLSLERVGIYIHHVATSAACLYILNCEYGKGYMLINALQALMGSLLYCIWRLNQLNTTLYCVTMTLSNILAVTLTMKYFFLALSKGDIAVLFTALCIPIGIVRQYPVMEIILKRGRQSCNKNDHGLKKGN